ncbi:MAG: hypothetical protein AB1715_14300, partial [Acidobacteriota bacterium]
MLRPDDLFKLEDFPFGLEDFPLPKRTVRPETITIIAGSTPESKLRPSERSFLAERGGPHPPLVRPLQPPLVPVEYKEPKLETIWKAPFRAIEKIEQHPVALDIAEKIRKEVKFGAEMIAGLPPLVVAGLVQSLPPPLQTEKGRQWAADLGRQAVAGLGEWFSPYLKGLAAGQVALETGKGVAESAKAAADPIIEAVIEHPVWRTLEIYGAVRSAVGAAGKATVRPTVQSYKRFQEQLIHEAEAVEKGVKIEPEVVVEAPGVAPEVPPSPPPEIKIEAPRVEAVPPSKPFAFDLGKGKAASFTILETA